MASAARLQADWNAYAYYFYGNSYFRAGLEATGRALKAVGHPDADKVMDAARDLVMTSCDHSGRLSSRAGGSVGRRHLGAVTTPRRRYTGPDGRLLSGTGWQSQLGL
jgi:hypothetical protein